MLTAKEIEKAAVTCDNPPEAYHTIENNLFFALQNLLSRYKRGGITKEQAGRLKTKIISNYERDVKIYETYMYYNSLINQTQLLRIELRKNPKIETALKLIECYSGEVGMWNLDSIKEKLLK